MKGSIYDEALAGILEVIEEVSDEISSEFKGKAPFDKEPIPDEDLLYEYNTKGRQVFTMIADTQGLAAGKNYINKMETLKKKRQGGQ